MLFRASDSADIRPEILALVAESPGWGIVVRPAQGHGDVRREVACAGLPDIGAVDELVVPNRSTDAVKVGFEDHQEGCEATALAILDRLRLPGYDRVFLEPYCDSSDCLAQLADMVKTLSPQDIVLKVRVNDDGLDVLKRAEIGATPWVARSDGMSWADYSARLPRARGLGAVGVMVGRAIWGDTVHVGTDVRRGSILDRMEAITRIF